MNNNNDIDRAIQEFLSNGGEVTRLRYSDKKDTDKATRMSFHRVNQGDKAASKDAVDRAHERESALIFSKVDRWKE
jgi:hypothetical protein